MKYFIKPQHNVQIQNQIFQVYKISLIFDFFKKFTNFYTILRSRRADSLSYIYFVVFFFGFYCLKCYVSPDNVMFDHEIYKLVKSLIVLRTLIKMKGFLGILIIKKEKSEFPRYSQYLQRMSSILSIQIVIQYLKLYQKMT